MQNKYILGLNIYHGDSSACIMKNGEIIFAIEEERINRIKHWAGFPIQSIKYCLNYAGISLDQVDYIAINSNFYSNFLSKVKYGLTNFKNYKLILSKLVLRRKKKSINNLLRKYFNSSIIPKIVNFDHHLCHIASAYFPSNKKSSLLISADGFGDFSSTVAAVASNSSIYIKHKVLFPHSLGIFYQAFTQFLGFKNYGDEYKVMGLSAYGKNKFKEEMDKILILENGSFKLNLNYFQHHRNIITMKWENEAPKFNNLYNNNLNKLFNFNFDNKEISEIHMDLARSIQDKYEEIILNYISFYKKKFDLDHLSLAGGCAMNSLANGKIYDKLGFKDIYIPPAPGDAGGAIGAAILCDKKFFNNSKIYYSTPYIGSVIDGSKIEKKIKSILHSSKERENISLNFYEKDQELVGEVAKEIYNEKVVGWYQDRMEWGPRALGNRSILANPCSPNMKGIINLKIKRRESFRPFAPSILKEYVSDWFETKADVPYMGMVFKIKQNKQKKLPAVTHVDGTGRLQTVDKKTNKLYYELINSFKELTGVPMLLNTSFNENEPIVNTLEEAIYCFLRTKMDLLVIGNYILKR